MARLGFVGVGDMGGPMAAHLVDAGHDVTAFDLDDVALDAAVETGATRGDSAAAVATDADVVLLSLPGPAEVETVVDDLEPALERGTVLVDTTTSRPALTNRLAGRLDDRSVEMVGAPVSGGPHGAQAGTLSVMVGGEPAVVEAVDPILEAFSTERFQMGPAPGDGHATKLLNNYLSYTALVATSEAVILGASAGLDPGQLVSVFSASTGRNSATDYKFPELILAGEDHGFPLALSEKDTRLFTEFARDQDVPVMLGHVTHHLLGYARRAEGDDADLTRVYDFLESVMTR
jgi:3-hydroxyisobutyrate dehydrogenase-like beta-hydroxyacid dehydrogenase